MDLFGIKRKTAMEQEIYAQPDVLAGILKKENIDKIDIPCNIDKIVLVASGS